MIKEIIQKLIKLENLTKEEAKNVMEEIMTGQATPSQIAAFLTALRIKGETIDEITSFAEVMRSKALKPKSIQEDLKDEILLDTCGTGGSGVDTFNISTAVALVGATCGVKVAKHGNRAASSKCGSADVLEKLGVKIDLSPEKVLNSILKVGIGFIFAPSFHVAMKYAIGPRREMGIRTVFNILGPLTNPFSPNAQILGVFSETLTEPLANVLLNLGVKRGFVVYGYDRTDEISITAKTKIAEIVENKIRTYTIEPEDFNFKKANLSEIEGKGLEENAQILISIFKGEKGPRRDCVVLNSAFALVAAQKVKNVSEGIKLVNEVLDSGKVLEKLEEFKEFSNE